MEELKKMHDELSAEFEALKAHDDSPAIDKLVSAYKQELSERYATEKAAKMEETAADIRALDRLIDRLAKQIPEATAEVQSIPDELEEPTEPEAVEAAPEIAEPTTTE